MTIAELWANQIISGKKTYEQVPNKLKEAVAKILDELDKTNETVVEDTSVPVFTNEPTGE